MQVAIEHAMTILSWHENLGPEEIPPQHLWHDPDGLEEWWDYVKEKREARFGGSRVDPSDDDVEENELASAFKKR